MHAAALNLKVNPANTESLELLDEMDGTIYTLDLLTQYFTCLYTELSKRAGADGKGIRKTVFMEVFLTPLSHSILLFQEFSRKESIPNTTNLARVSYHRKNLWTRAPFSLVRTLKISCASSLNSLISTVTTKSRPKIFEL